nr:MAG TPA: Receptor Binding Protein [Caudoviricetes sp.]
MSIITYPLDIIEYEAKDAETYLCSRTSGVFASTGHFDASITGAREVTISSGLAWIKNADFKGKSVLNDTAVPISIPIADGVLDRVDRIVLQFSKTANATSIVLKSGTPSAAAVAPAIVQTETVYELGLYTVSVPAGSTTILASHVTDTRMDETVCGLMRDGVTGIPTAELQAQVEALIGDLQEQIRNAAQGIISPAAIGAMGIGADNGAVGTKYTTSIEPDTADNTASIIRIKENATGNTRVLIAANTDVNTGEVSQIVLRDGTNVGKINIQCNTAGAKGIRITDSNNVERIKLLHTTTDDTCRFQINDASGNDVTLQTIGAQPKRMSFTDVSVPDSAWVDDSYDQYTDFPYQAQVECAGVTSDMFAEVVLNPSDAISGNYAPICVTGSGVVWLYAKTIPTAATTIRSIVVWR